MNAKLTPWSYKLNQPVLLTPFGKGTFTFQATIISRSRDRLTKAPVYAVQIPSRQSVLFGITETELAPLKEPAA